MTDSTQTMSDTQLRLKALLTLKKELGIADTLRFLARVHQKSTKYVEISHQIYAEQQLNEIFARVKQNWQG